MMLHPIAFQAHLVNLSLAEHWLHEALREGARQSRDWPPHPSVFEARDYARRQHWADRIERFVRVICTTLVELQRDAQAPHDPDTCEALRMLSREVNALLLQPIDEKGTTLSKLLLQREPSGAWGLDMLNLEFCVRRRPAELLLLLEAFASEQLGLLLLLLRHFEMSNVTALLKAAESSAFAPTT